MNGDVALEAVYEKRLSLIQPNIKSINDLAEQYIAEIVEGVKEVFAVLLAEKKSVHIISGGLRQAILPLAHTLGLPDSHVHAVDIFFNEDGSYRRFDQESPLARTGGKTVVIELLKAQGSVVMIGDGKTDLEAQQAGAFVIGFGGVVDRSIVRERADVYINEHSLLKVLEHIL